VRACGFALGVTRVVARALQSLAHRRRPRKEHRLATSSVGVIPLEDNMQLRTISFLAVLTLAASGCGTAPTDNVNESVDEAKKTDAGRDCRPSAPGAPSPCAKGGPGGDHGGQGKSDAGKGHGDADDDDDDDDDDEDGGRKDGGKK
jgi:hypothetical protein